MILRAHEIIGDNKLRKKFGACLGNSHKPLGFLRYATVCVSRSFAYVYYTYGRRDGDGWELKVNNITLFHILHCELMWHCFMVFL